jgi:hypothetical protein
VRSIMNSPSGGSSGKRSSRSSRVVAANLAYIVGLTQLGLRVNATLAVPNQGRLESIIQPIGQSDFSIHDLSRIEVSEGIPRFNMPVELGLALYRSHIAKGRHRVFVFETKSEVYQRH